LAAGRRCCQFAGGGPAKFGGKAKARRRARGEASERPREAEPKGRRRRSGVQEAGEKFAEEKVR